MLRGVYVYACVGVGVGVGKRISNFQTSNKIFKFIDNLCTRIHTYIHVLIDNQNHNDDNERT